MCWWPCPLWNDMLQFEWKNMLYHYWSVNVSVDNELKNIVTHSGIKNSKTLFIFCESVRLIGSSRSWKFWYLRTESLRDRLTFLLALACNPQSWRDLRFGFPNPYQVCSPMFLVFPIFLHEDFSAYHSLATWQESYALWRMWRKQLLKEKSWKSYFHWSK